jgi:hypothetical protein
MRDSGSVPDWAQEASPPTHLLVAALCQVLRRCRRRRLLLALALAARAGAGGAAARKAAARVGVAAARDEGVRPRGQLLGACHQLLKYGAVPGGEGGDAQGGVARNGVELLLGRHLGGGWEVD